MLMSLKPGGVVHNGSGHYKSVFIVKRGTESLIQVFHTALGTPSELLQSRLQKVSCRLGKQRGFQ